MSAILLATLVDLVDKYQNCMRVLYELVFGCKRECLYFVYISLSFPQSHICTYQFTSLHDFKQDGWGVKIC